MNQPTTSVHDYGFAKTTALLAQKNLLLGGAGKRQAMSCDVVFGSPSANCSGAGVCKISARHTTQPTRGQQRDCQSTLGVFTAAEGGRGFTLLLFREFLCVRILRSHLLTGVLKVEEPCRLPSALVDFLHLQTPAIQPGHYPIEEVDGNFRIQFGSANH